VSRIHDALKKAEEERLKTIGHLPEAAGVQDASAGRFSATVPEILFDEGTESTDTVLPSMEHVTTLPVVDRLQNCSKPVWSPTKDAIFMTAQDNNAPGLEEFRTLRAKLFQIRAKRPLKTVLISSALPSEGKSFVSANLAQAFARQRGSRTLLIDADLRKPHMHQLFGAPSSPGLGDYLAGKASEFEIIQRSANNEDLFFVPGGNPNANAAELIGNGRIKHLFDIVGPLFSWIVIDSSPVIPVSDPTRLAEISDGVLLVVQAGATSHIVAERAKREFHDTPLLGVVFNQVKAKENPYYKYSYSHYGRGK
jgi:capsular exopolysaccharide synthesis family protein